MDFQRSKQKNMGMPARHISSQSFDEILSDLGDDPAIPDPHGIRKPPPQKNIPPRPQINSSSRSFTESLDNFQIPKSIQNLGGSLILIGILITSGILFFIAFQNLNNQSKVALEESQKQLSELRKDIALMREEILQDQDDLYSAIDEIEVSIHSLKYKKPEARVSSKPQTATHETELRRWRYLGASQMGALHQAYFHTGESHISLEKGAQVLGDWRLSNIEKGLATLTHPNGKSLVMKTSKAE
jgi:hypothetical protein